ncbi:MULTISPECIES: hypothetical protein [unclassified Lentimicrobium]|uniref:hypothetical protein n=1 Tax=unclassified Lentimicrobium TaxID=2677434 RepID=UPI001552E647|nr:MULTISPECIES: hypothetical protein [unclassified Lentimicrobium]NPD45108.1 hypothetical protein [Lentimicrobium sp. S6]NPD85374.1 hypothetical protein [Lentimicrobium sp. L6]
MQINLRTSYLLIVFIFIGFLGGGIYFYQQLFQGIKDPVKLIPDDAALIIEIPQFDKLYQNWDSESSYGKVLKEWPKLESFQYFLPQVLTYFEEETAHFTDLQQPVLLSRHQQGWLLLFPSFGYSLQNFERDILSQLNESPITQEKTLESEYYLELNQEKHQLCISEKRGWYFISDSPELLVQSIGLVNGSNKFRHSEEFQSLEKVSGKRSDAHVFINFDKLKDIYPQNASETPSIVWQNPKNIAAWTGLDLSIKTNELLLNGYSIPGDSGVSLMNIFQDQESVGMTISDHFPYQTKSYYHLSLNDYSSYYQAWKSYLKSSGQWGKYSKSILEVENGLKQKPEELHAKWWAGEMANIKTEDGKEYGLFLAQQGRESYRLLSDIAHLSQPSMISMDYKNLKLKEINYPDFLMSQFGPWFSTTKKSYFAVVDELVIFSKSIEDLKEYIDLLESGSILQKKESYHEFSDNLSKNTNFTFYVNRPHSVSEIFNIFQKKEELSINELSIFKKDLNGYSLQLNWKNRMVYTGIFAGLSGEKTEKSSQWQVLMDSDIVSGPFIVTDHTDASHKYIVFDDFRQMYLINEQGDIVWKKQIEEKPISNVFEIDYYGNGKIQYLFNSENYMYLIDLTGNFVANYPLKLNSEASTGLSVIDYQNNKDYRILIPCLNGEVYNYKKDGSLLKDWKSKNTRKQIVKPMSHVVANSKDYLIAEAQNGNIIMFDRNGKVRLEIRKSFTNALGSDVYANRTNSKGMMITTDSDGKLIYIPEKGQVKSTDFGDYSKDHFFIYSDFSGNGNYDFIYLDGQELNVFDRLKKSFVNYIFERPILIKPQLFSVSGRKILAVFDKEGETLYLFNSDGLMSKKLKGNTGYVIDVNKRNKPMVLIGKGKALMKYPI